MALTALYMPYIIKENYERGIHKSMKNFFILLSLIFVFFITNGCGMAIGINEDDDYDNYDEFYYDTLEKNIRLRIDGVLMSVTWENNNSVRELKRILRDRDLIINTNQYGGFEQVGSLGYSLENHNRDITTSPGDIVLYNGNQIVIFYGTNSWSYTRLGKLTGKTQTELENILNKPGVALRLSLEN